MKDTDTATRKQATNSILVVPLQWKQKKLTYHNLQDNRCTDAGLLTDLFTVGYGQFFCSIQPNFEFAMHNSKFQLKSDSEKILN